MVSWVLKLCSHFSVKPLHAPIKKSTIKEKK